jgi:hypothetical protein
MLAYGPMKRLAALCAACAACAAFGYASDSPHVQPFDLVLEAGKDHEECMRLQAGEQRKWYWRANAPVDFNIHYHEGPEAFFPVKRAGMRGDGGTFTAKISQDYCWMWTAKDKPAKLEGRIESK